MAGGWTIAARSWALAATINACGADDVAGLESDTTTGYDESDGSEEADDDDTEDAGPPSCEPGPSIGTTLELAPMRTRRTRHAAAELASGDLVVVGGAVCNDEVGRDGLISSTERYSRTDDAWTEIAALPRPRADHAALVLADDRLMIFGGVTDAGRSADVTTYDAATDTWVPGAPLPETLDHPLAVALADGRAFVMDGYHGSRAYLLDSLDASWSQTSPVTGVGDWSSLVALPDGRALVASSGQSPGILVVYDPVSDTWVDADPFDTSGWIGSAALLTETSVLLLHDEVADSEGSAVGSGAIWNSDDETHDWPGGGRFCWGSLHTWGHVTNTRGVGRGAGRAMVFGDFQSFMFDVEFGWTNPADLEIPMEGAAIVELADGGILVLGGESHGLGCEHSARVQLWTP